MDTTADTPSDVTRHAPITLRLVVGLGVLFVAGVLVAIAVLFNIAQKLDAEDVRKTHFYIERALDNRITASKNYITSYAFWTTAYEHLNGEVDVQWAYAEQNMGKTLFTNDEYDGVFVIDRERTKYAVVRGQNIQVEATAYLDTSLTDLVDQLQAQADLTMPLIRYTLFDGWPAIVTASVITPNDERPQVDRRGTSVLLFVDQLTPVKLRKLGKGYGLTDLNLV
jgi:sensor domain CHASE-containing protein